ncbi:hypothetical protein [Haloglomus halophilum]|uniref:hypothetical protein n=1 Tax=Haloglomus halophilum TaxID=2962672 RepID=UPI0020C9E6D8|nr:hypothetical protein [Haloglomus halophilum]
MTETTSNAPERLVPYLRGSLGRGLRTVIRYHDDGYERLYCDEGLSDEVRAALREADTGSAGTAVRNTLGARRGTIECYEDTVLVHLPEGNDRGTLVTADPDALSELYDLLRGIHHHQSVGAGAERGER